MVKATGIHNVIFSVKEWQYKDKEQKWNLWSVKTAYDLKEQGIKNII